MTIDPPEAHLDRFRVPATPGRPAPTIRLVVRPAPWASGDGTPFVPVVVPAPERSPRPFTPHAGPPMADREAVVARYREDVAWLAALPMSARLYDGGPEPPSSLPANVTRVPKPNVGREAYSYLQHITDRYDDLAETTIFTQADPFDHSPDFLARVRGRFDATTSLTTRYLADRPPDWIKARDRVEVVNGLEVRYGDARIDAHGPAGGTAWFDLAAWDYVFACPAPAPLWFGYAATYAVPWRSIRARPLGFWRWLRAELERPECGYGASSRTDPPINPWSLEAVFYSLFSDPAEFPHRPDRTLGPAESPGRCASCPAAEGADCPARGVARFCAMQTRTTSTKAAARMPVAEHRRLMVLVNQCDFRGCITGCQKTACSHPEKAGEKYLSQCVTCQQEATA